MLDIIRKLRAILEAREVKRFSWLLVAFLVMSIFEVVGIASIMPFMQLVANPEIVSQNEWLGKVYDFFGFEDVSSFLLVAGICVLLLMASANAVMIFTTWLQHKFVWSSVHELAERLLRTYTYQPYERFLSENTSDLGQKILGEVNTLANSVLLPLVEFIARVAVSVVIFALLIAVDPQLAIIVFLVLGGTYAIIYYGIRRYLMILGKERLQANRLRFRMASEALSNIKLIKTRGAEEFFVHRFSVAEGRFSVVQPKFKVLSTTPRYLVQTLAFGGILTIVLYLIADEQTFAKALPLLSLYALAGYRLMPSLQLAFTSISQLRYGAPAVETIYDDLQAAAPVKPSRSKRSEPALQFEKAIRLQQVSYSYSGSEEVVLTDVNLMIPKNSSMAFVGPTGSGKSTLVEIIIGLLELRSGRLLVDDVEITTRNVRDWQAKIGYVPQDVALYDDTILRNIAFGVRDADIDPERVRQVATTANIHSFIVEQLPQGYQAHVGERGVRLSGGQRQRIGLARALYHRPEVLILDEATSALDGITEEAVMDAISQVRHQMTVIIIAHRMATVRDCDHIVLLDRGRIVAEGTYEDLLRSSFMFKSMAQVA